MSERSQQTQLLAEEKVNVRVRWHETCHYDVTIEVPRADYVRMKELSVGTRRNVERLESELMTNFNLAKTEAVDWDDLEIDGFHEVTP